MYTASCRRLRNKPLKALNPKTPNPEPQTLKQVWCSSCSGLGQSSLGLASFRAQESRTFSGG